jgi:hypothetical protein
MVEVELARGNAKLVRVRADTEHELDAIVVRHGTVDAITQVRRPTRVSSNVA